MLAPASTPGCAENAHTRHYELTDCLCWYSVDHDRETENALQGLHANCPPGPVRARRKDAMMAKRKPMHPLMLRILAGEDVSQCEISEWNAQWIMDWVRRGPHDADRCWSKHCVHGARDEDIEYAARLASHEFCCGGV